VAEKFLIIKSLIILIFYFKILKLIDIDVCFILNVIDNYIIEYTTKFYKIDIFKYNNIFYLIKVY